ncbi:hypothetical protein SYNPS1DRAFT_28532 [Syncephalis pseudoplumigaleata]|uniref:Sec20 C-terminal domain-containing protein n=1 Tax=Syncephalis pseudoplumigaleata TaxID=1712513 RepID=A0A4P9Z0G3_9FUNG|nr:hypothetical protein SYNPS1DRAFT_28532 [Syncephalis pseudoplumigaleata]|eukprot:RKP25745.1 hypothetical protein SYNPS1DRAFT_28532 [Syncephalis pseudoplumigaleata]
MTDSSLPATTHEDADRLTGLSRRALAVEQLISALHAPADTGAAAPISAMALAIEQRDLVAAARTQLRQFERAIVDARELAEDEDRETDRAAILRQIERHDAHRKQLQAALRKATLEGKRKVDAHARIEREALLGGNGAHMSKESSRLLRSAHGEYRALDTVLRTSRQVLTRLERGDWTDRLLILFGLFVFSLVVLYVIKRRFWLPGVGWLSRSLWALVMGADAPKDEL